MESKRRVFVKKKSPLGRRRPGEIVGRNRPVIRVTNLRDELRSCLQEKVLIVTHRGQYVPAFGFLSVPQDVVLQVLAFLRLPEFLQVFSVVCPAL